MTQNQGSPGSGAGIGDPNESGTNAAAVSAGGLDPHHPGGQGGDHGQAVNNPGTALDRRFPDPGLPAHVHRSTDVDQKAARRAERQVSGLFLLSFLGTVLFVVSYFAFPVNGTDDVATSRLLLGLGLGLAMFGIGAGAVHWAKKLMPDDEVVDERHAIRSTAQDRVELQGILQEGAVATGFPRRRMIWGSLTAAMGALALPAIIPFRDLWIQGDAKGPVDQISVTAWSTDTLLVTDPEGAPIRPEDVKIGSVVHVLPEGLAPGGAQGEEEGESAVNKMNERAKAGVLLMRLQPDEINEGQDKAYEGILAYSVICTHMGCPVALYEQTTHHLLCPCHQSTFDVPNGCNVIFGPAARSLPQLAITVNADGYLVSKDGFAEPVGPSFWERG